jgi:hypothetical protein
MLAEPEQTRPELTAEWIQTRANASRILGIAHDTLKVIPTSIKARDDDPTTFDVETLFPLQDTPYIDVKYQDGVVSEQKQRDLPPEEHFRQSVEAALNAEHKPLGFKIGTITHQRPAP